MQVAKRTPELAQLMVGAGGVGALWISMMATKGSIVLLFSFCFPSPEPLLLHMQVAKHTPELAQLVVGAGGVGALVDYVAATKGNTRLPGIMALGYIAAFSETLGLAVIAEKGLVRSLLPLLCGCAPACLCGLLVSRMNSAQQRLFWDF